jgi:hypothetical protein
MPTEKLNKLDGFTIDEPIIWDSHFGYDVGYFKGEGALFETYAIQLETGVVQDTCCYPKTEIHKYSPEKISELAQKYGYKKEL